MESNFSTSRPETSFSLGGVGSGVEAAETWEAGLDSSDPVLPEIWEAEEEALLPEGSFFPLFPLVKTITSTTISTTSSRPNAMRKIGGGPFFLLLFLLFLPPRCGGRRLTGAAEDALRGT